MNRHLSQDTLIQYIFDLGDTPGADIARHLDECPDCAAAHDQLKAKFAALDTLNEDIKAGDSLLGRTIAAAKTPAKPARNRFAPPTWLTAAAAVLLIGTLALTIYKIKGSDPFISDSPDVELAYKNEPFDFSEPPFAPASAIELNVLPKKESSQITIYNSEDIMADITFVREKRKLTLKRGWNWLQFMWANTLIDPTSLSLEPTQHKGKVRIEQLVFPPRLKNIGRWLIASEVEGPVEFELTYFTSGFFWHAFYMGTLTPDEKQMKLEGYVKVRNITREDFENIQTRLIVGKVNLLDRIADLAQRKHPYNSPQTIVGIRSLYARYASDEDDGLIRDGEKIPLLGDMPAIGGVFRGIEVKEVKKQGLSEYFLYTIEGTEDIKNQWAKRLPSFSADEIDVESLYKYDEALYGNNVTRFVSFKNDADHNLGVTPIPDGSMKIYAKTNDAGNLSFTGSTNIKYIPVNEKVELNLGNARGVIVQPKVMDIKTQNYTYDKNGNIDGYDKLTTYKLDIRNTRKLDIKVEIKRHFETTAWEIESNYDYEKIDADTIKYTLDMKPETKLVIEYTLTTHHGKNETIYNKTKTRSASAGIKP